MPISLSKLVDKIKPSFTLQMTARAAALREKGIDVINFGVGEPDFDTPPHIIEAGKNAIEDGYTKYTPGSGMLELKEAIQTKINNMTGILYETDQIIVSNGGAITVLLHSDAAVNGSGFEADWSCTFPLAPPVSVFEVSDSISCDGFVFEYIFVIV